MQVLNLPSYPFKIKRDGQSSQIFDIIRRKYIALTPEEWVRQHIIHFLINEKGVPSSLMAVEAGLVFNTLKKRSDLVVYDKSVKPVLLVECKASSVRISQEVFDQAARYSQPLYVKYLLITNGLVHYFCEIDRNKNKFLFREDIPQYREISGEKGT